MHRLFLTILLVLVLAAPAAARRKKQPPPHDVEAVSAELMGRALAGSRAWEDLVYLCDRIGNRISGSESLERAIAWAKDRMDVPGVDATLEPVQVPKWVRGAERATLLAPIERNLPLLGLGMTIGTPEGGVEAEVLVVSSWEELEARKAEAAGRIVLYDVPFTTYRETVQFRSKGPSAASRLGAVAALVRSVGPSSLSTPHTGALRYADDTPPIPAAALTVEDSATLRRLQDRGVTPRIRLELGAKHHGDVPSFNVVGELRGRELPDEVVVLGCHIDSWDVGQGAQDDGAGCVMVMEALRLMAELETPPRRTVRAVLYTNEENGLAGGRAYAKAHAGEAIVAALEADTGAGPPLGWRLDVRGEEPEVQALKDAAAAAFAPIQARLMPLGATGLRYAYAGADIGPLIATGVPGLGVDFDTTGYWPIHHTEADTVDKIDPAVFARNVAVMTVTGYGLAELDGRLVAPETP